MAGSRRNVDQKRITILWAVLALTIFLLVFYVTPVLLNFKYTWQEPPSSPGTLKNERWGRDFWFVLTLGLMWLVPITSLWMIAYPAKDYTRGIHTAISIILFIYYAVIMIVWALDYSHANGQTAANSRNPFNDDRWCLVNYLIPGVDCLVTAPAVPPVTQAMLLVNGAMAFTFWMLVVFLLFLIIDIAYTLIVYQPAVREYVNAKRKTLKTEKFTLVLPEESRRADDRRADPLPPPATDYNSYSALPNPNYDPDNYGYPNVPDSLDRRIRTRLQPLLTKK